MWGPKFLFQTVTEGILDSSLYISKYKQILTMFLRIKCFMNQAMNDIWTNFSVKTFRIYDRNETRKCGGLKWGFLAQTHIEKTTLKVIYTHCGRYYR